MSEHNRVLARAGLRIAAVVGGLAVLVASAVAWAAPTATTSYSFTSEPGDFIGGQWTFGQKVFAPVASFEYAWWNPNAVSQFDNQKGAYQWCNGGTMYTNGDLAALGGPRQQMACFGK